MRSRGMGIAAVAALTVTSALTGCSGSSGKGAAASNASTGAGASNASNAGGGSSTSGTAKAPGPVKGKPFTVTIGASGDVISQPQVVPVAKAQAGGKGYNYDPFFAPMKSIFSAPDVSICQMEDPLSTTNTNLSRELSFNAPHEQATAVKKAGFDGCSTANNHAYDRGLSGLKQTRQVMDQAHLKAAGPASSNDSSGQPAWYETKGIKIAQLSYSFSLTNQAVDPPADAPWIAKNLIGKRGAKGIEQDAAAARAQGADLVVVSLHMGTEYKTKPNAEQTKLAKQLLDSGQVDWIIGNHPHAVEPCQKISGRYVDYALGNTFSGQSRAYFPTVRQGVFATTTFTRDDDGKITESQTYQPTFGGAGPPFDVEPATPTSHKENYDTAVQIMGSMGCDAKPAK